MNDFYIKKLKYNAFVYTSLGLVLKIGLKDKIPEGFRKMTVEEGRCAKLDLNKIIDHWGIVGFQNGKIDGMGYGNKIQYTYGA